MSFFSTLEAFEFEIQNIKHKVHAVEKWPHIRDKKEELGTVFLFLSGVSNHVY